MENFPIKYLAQVLYELLNNIALWQYASFNFMLNVELETTHTSTEFCDMQV